MEEYPTGNGEPDAKGGRVALLLWGMRIFPYQKKALDMFLAHFKRLMGLKINTEWGRIK